MGFIQLTDLHFVPGDASLYGMRPKDRLAEGVAMINASHADEDCVFVTGDLAHFGQLEAYESLKHSLDALALPYHLLMGNHDSRAPFRKVFKGAPEIEGGFVQFVIETEEARLLCLDTLHDVPGDHMGQLCETRLRWLDAQIAATPESKRLLLAAHHPFFHLGLPNLDDLTLRDPEALWEVLQRRKPDLFLFGHVHRPISGVYRGVPFHTQLAFNHQVTLGFHRTPSLVFCEERPDLAIIHAIDDGLAVFTRSVGGEFRTFPAGEENTQRYAY